MNYEDVVEQALINGLKEKFSIEDINKLVPYLFARYAVFHGADNIGDANLFMNFVLKELGIFCHESNIYGKHIEFYINDETVPIIIGYSDHNNLLNIFDSIKRGLESAEFVDSHGESMSIDDYIKVTVSDVQRQATHRLRPYRKSRYSNELQTFFKLQVLNEKFCVKTPIDAPELPMFNQSEARMSIEALYERYLHAEHFDTTNVHSITEAQVRDYLYVHLDLIEEGLKPMMKEFPTKEGRVDIVARDKDGNLVVIEIKTENDKRLIWQCMYYPDEVKKKLDRYEDNKKVRMLTIAPEYPEFILKPIEKLGYVESYTYTIKAFNKNIEEMNVEMLQKEKEVPCDPEVDVDIQKQLDGVIGAFIYTRRKLEESNGWNMKDKDLDEVALELVKMVHGKIER